MRNSRGFTLIELLVVVGIIGIIVAIAIPALLRSRMSANEGAVVGAMKAIAAGQTDYYNNSSSNPRSFSSNLENLGSGFGAGNVPFIDPQLSTGVKAGYTFLITPQAPIGNNGYIDWFAQSWPLNYRSTGVRSFYIDQSGTILGSDVGGVPGDSSMPTTE